MPSGFSAQHFAKGAPINDSTSSTSTTYSSSKIDQKIASVGGGGGSTTFLALTDTPASFSANQTIRANAAGNALEFYTPSAGVTTFLGLSDTPASFSANQTLRVNAAGNALEYYTPSAGASTFLALTDTPSSFTNGKLLYSTASGVELTSTQIAIDGGNIEVDQVNARQNDTTNIGDSSHRFNTVHCLALHQGSGKLILPTTAGSAGQVLSIASVNGSDMTLGFTTGSSGPTYIDIHCQVGVATPSGAINITNNNPTNESPTDRKGVSWGNRLKTMFVKHYEWASVTSDVYRDAFRVIFNGRYAGTLLELGVPITADSWMPYYAGEYGYMDFQAPLNYRYNFSKIALYYYGSGASTSGTDNFTIYGSNDGVEFTTIANLTMQNFTNSSSGGTSAPTGYTASGSGVGSNYTCHWYSFTNNNFYRIYRWQWKEFSNYEQNNSSTNYFRRGLFFQNKKYLCEIEYH